MWKIENEFLLRNKLFFPDFSFSFSGKLKRKTFSSFHFGWKFWFWNVQQPKLTTSQFSWKVPHSIPPCFLSPRDTPTVQSILVWNPFQLVVGYLKENVCFSHIRIPPSWMLSIEQSIFPFALLLLFSWGYVMSHL